MSDSTKCSRCGGELPSNFPPGVCPTCLLQQGLSPSTFISGAGASSKSGGGRRRSWTPPTPAELAPRFPQLEIVELLGQGGMGAVYKVRQKDLDRWAALKVLPDDVAHDPNFAERFQREARALALLGHQYIVIVYEFGQRDGVYFLLMEYIDGVTLRQAIRAGQISAKDALGIVTQICDALQFAHEEGVVHRDIKPENILIDKRGRVKIADFGLAKLLGGSVEVPTLTGTHQVMGTPMYMAPEQMEGTRGVDHRADIFSLGVVFYELLTGELPLGRFAPPSQKYSLDVRLDEVVLRTLEKEPDRRYQQASDVKVDVESIRSQPQLAKPEKPNRRFRSFQLWRGFNRPIPPSETTTLSWWRVAKLFSALVTIAFLLCAMAGFIVHQGNVITAMNADNVQQRRALAQHQAANAIRRDAFAQQQDRPIPSLPEATTDDPNEINAYVQFTNEGPRLNPLFGRNELAEDQRRTVNQILAKVHNEYLAVENSCTNRESKEDGTQVSAISIFSDEVTKLENELWMAIDSKLPVAQQRFLRLNLPLFASEGQPLRQLAPDGTAYFDGMSLMGAASGPMAIGFPPMAGAAMGGSPMIPAMGGVAASQPNLRYPQIFGWKRDQYPMRISVGRRGRWYRWSIEMGMGAIDGEGVIQTIVYAESDRGEAPELPFGLRRFWREPGVIEQQSTAAEGAESIGASMQDPGDRPLMPDFQPAAVKASQIDQFNPQTIVGPDQKEESDRFVNPQHHKSLDAELREIDKLRAGADTPFDEVERRTNDLLTRFKTVAEKGRIHWQAAHVYGQSGIDKTSASVIRHASEALKYERDPNQRGWMYMYLGSAVQVRDNDPKTFVERRAEATRWLLKGYAELLAFRLPEIAPELPGVDKVGDMFGGTNGEIDPEQVAMEVRHAAQMRARKEAEFIRELVQRRDTYISVLRDTFIRLHAIYDKESDARERLIDITKEILRDPKETQKLLNYIWPEKINEPSTASIRSSQRSIRTSQFRPTSPSASKL